MKNKKNLIVIQIIIFSLIFTGCTTQSNNVGYTIFLTPSDGAKTTLIIPVVWDDKSGKMDQVMSVEPRFPKGNASVEIIETEKGTALKIETTQELQLKFSKRYSESGSELIASKTLSMTNKSNDEVGKPIMKSWFYLNSSTNQTERFWVIFSTGGERTLNLELSGRNVSNGWHQITLAESIAVV